MVKLIKPFIKWAGGKTQILDDIRLNYPDELGISITKYCEPFVGGGAVLFDIMQNYSLSEVYINDINAELINTYIQLKEHIEDVVMELLSLQEIFLNIELDKIPAFYYEKRERFNHIKNTDKNIEKAVLFIFLNKTCFNGLYRVNKNGLFNVPIGTPKKSIICDKENLFGVNKLLEKVSITCGDYKQCAQYIDENTFVYIDPPYRPISKTANFNSYTESPFHDTEQIVLGEFVDSINTKGAKILLSNSDPKNINPEDEFFDDIYRSYQIKRICAKRMINSSGDNRGAITELLINNF